jgi:dipeptidase E
VAGRHVVAIGGGAFTNRPLDAEILRLTGKERPRVCFLPTAMGDDAWGTVSFYAALGNRVDATHLELFDRTVENLVAFLLGQDVIYVGGGNTASMLGVWRAHGVDEILREAWQRGIVLCGWSAGAICWFEASVTDSFGPLAALRDGLGLLPGSACPHYDGEPERRPTYRRLVEEGLPSGIAIDDDVGVRYEGTELAEVLTCRERATAYRVELREGDAVETPLDARLLDRSKA